MKIMLLNIKKKTEKSINIVLVKYHQALLLNKHRQFQQRIFQVNS